MTWEEIGALAGERTIALLPVAAIEQHGPHLPLGVDVCLVEGVLARAIELMPSELPVVILPTQTVGKSDEHLAFPGTLTCDAATLVAQWTQIGEAVARAGVRKLVLFNSHGGNPSVMEIVARDLRVRLGMVVASASWYSFGIPEGLFPAHEVRHGIHAGAIETSMMLHLRPDLVRREKARRFDSLGERLAAQNRWLGPGAAAKIAWQTQDLNPDGACGDATAADAERGAKLVEHAARCLTELLAEVDRFPVSALVKR
jgi:creatinine amidohydrolase